MKTYLKIVGVFGLFATLTATGGYYGYCDSNTSTTGADTTQNTTTMGDSTNSAPYMLAPNQVSPQDSVINQSVLTPTGLLNLNPIMPIGNPPLNKGGIYENGGQLLVDRDVRLPHSLMVSSVTVSSMNVTGAVQVPNGVNSSDAVAFGQISGKLVLQVVSCATSANDNTTSGTYQNTSTACSITPTKTTSKILILASGIATTSNGNTTNGTFTISGTTSGNLDGTNGLAEVLGVGANAFYNFVTMQIVDAPGTVSAQTYTVQFKSQGGATVSWGIALNTNMTLIELG